MAHHIPPGLLHDVPGGFPRGTLVRKINGEPSDVHPDGTEGTVIASLEHEGVIGYFVAFDSSEDAVTFVIDSRLEVPF